MSFREHKASSDTPMQDNPPEGKILKSEIIVRQDRRYYLDLKENNNGRFLRVSLFISRGMPRSQIAIPASGLREFKNALSELLEEFGNETRDTSGVLPESQSLNVGRPYILISDRTTEEDICDYLK